MPKWSIGRRQRDGLVASASVVNLKDREAIQRIALARRRWQTDAWSFYDQLPEIHYPSNYIGSTLGRFNFVIGEIPEDNPVGKPVVLEPSKRGDEYKAAEDLLAALRGPTGGIGTMARLYGMNMTIAAEGWLTGKDANGETDWEFLSVRELSPTENGEFLRDDIGLGSSTAYPYVPDFARRFWRAHPARTGIADSALNALAGDCNRLIALNESITSRLLARLSQAGVLFLPNTITVAGATMPADGDGNPVDNPFWKRFLDTMERAVTERNGAAGAIPIIVQGPGADGQNIKHITLDRSIDRVEMELRGELRSNIATGLDLPPEVQKGLGNMNHWTSWTVSDDTFSSHIKPLADEFSDGLTLTYIRPGLRTQGDSRTAKFNESKIRRLVVIADGSDVISRPNAAEDRRQLHDRSTISDKALREGSGVGESDAPSDDEYVRQIGRNTNTPYLATWGLPVHDEIDWTKVPGTAATDGAPSPGGTPASRRPADSNSPVKEQPKTPKKPAAADSIELCAAAGIGHLARAQQHVGAKVRALCEPIEHREVFNLLKPVPNERVLATIDDWEAIGLNDGAVRAMFVGALSGLISDLDQLGIDPDMASSYVAAVAALATGQQHHPIGIDNLRNAASGVLSTLED